MFGWYPCRSEPALKPQAQDYFFEYGYQCWKLPNKRAKHTVKYQIWYVCPKYGVYLFLHQMSSLV